tara:strand:- start:620 stop:1456 length:837 start_codon:yes stop_codon:yes gene_type:complete
MKNIYKLLTLVLTLTIVTSCDRDQGEYPYLDNREVTIGFKGAEATLLVEDGADNIIAATVGATTVVQSGSYLVSVDDSSTAVLGVDYDFVSGTVGSFESGNILSSISIVADFENSTIEGKTVVLNLISNDPSLSLAEAFSQYTINLIQFCPLNADFTGSYTLSTTVPGIFDSVVFLNGTVTIVEGANPTERVITVAPYPEFGEFPAVDFKFSLVCDNVNVGDVFATGVGCGGTTEIGPAEEVGSYDSDDDSSFNVIFTDDINGNCGAPIISQIVLTKN